MCHPELVSGSQIPQFPAGFFLEEFMKKLVIIATVLSVLLLFIGCHSTKNIEEPVKESVKEQSENNADLDIINLNHTKFVVDEKSNRFGYCYFVLDAPKEYLDCIKAPIVHYFDDGSISIFFSQPSKDFVEAK